MKTTYAEIEPAREEINNLTEPLLIEFGAPWCGHCQGAQPLIASAFKQYSNVKHFKIEDGKGKPLGRSFRVTLWPTLIFMSGGKEITRLVRPTNEKAILDALSEISTAA